MLLFVQSFRHSGAPQSTCGRYIDSRFLSGYRLRFLAIRQLGSTEGFGGSDSGFGSGFGSSFSMISRTTRSLGDIGQRSSANLRRA
jgi:hypothetical protein